MARAFDGGNDEVDCGTNASIADFATISMFAWFRRGTINENDYIMGKDIGSNVFQLNVLTTANSNRLEFRYQWTTGQGIWMGTTQFTDTGARNHIGVTYDNGATSNDPIIYVNGVAETLTSDTNPTGGPPLADSARILKLGENGGQGNDLTGDIGWFVYANQIFDASQINRARYWGRPGGGLEVYHPFMTTKLTNEGSATANGTATGSTVTAMPCPCVRPGSAMMGMGIGW